MGKICGFVVKPKGATVFDAASWNHPSAHHSVWYHCSAWGEVQWYTSFLRSWQAWQCRACRSYVLCTTFFDLSDALFPLCSLCQRISGEGQWGGTWRDPPSMKNVFSGDEKEEEEALGPAAKRIKVQRASEALHLQTPWLKGNFTAAKCSLETRWFMCMCCLCFVQKKHKYLFRFRKQQ